MSGRSAATALIRLDQDIRRHARQGPEARRDARRTPRGLHRAPGRGPAPAAPLLAFLLLALVAGPTAAQTRIGSAGVSVGYARLLADGAPAGGITADATLMAQLGPVFGLGLEGGYARFGAVRRERVGPCLDRSGRCTYIDEGRSSAWYAGAVARATLPGPSVPVRPHLSLGVGVHDLRELRSDLVYIGYSLGGGLTLGGAGRIRYRLELRRSDTLQHLAADRPTAYMTAGVGIQVSW